MINWILRLIPRRRKLGPVGKAMRAVGVGAGSVFCILGIRGKVIQKPECSKNPATRATKLAGIGAGSIANVLRDLTNS
ncbi:hypothetical protein OAO01_07100 [Oligoflexia bacterium]|nr:hypothetical protein [Oligoflexia bacterium]